MREMEKKLGLLVWVWFMLCGFCVGRFVVKKNNLKVTSPSSLNGVYECAIGNFGVPQYGGTMAGIVVYPEANHKACNGFDISFKSKPGGLPIFLLADRGVNCDDMNSLQGLWLNRMATYIMQIYEKKIGQKKMSFWSFINISLMIRLITSVPVAAAASLAKSGCPNCRHPALIEAKNCHHRGAFIRPLVVAMLLRAWGPVGGHSRKWYWVGCACVVCGVVCARLQVLSLSLSVEEGSSTFGVMARFWAKF
ncbi:hypothetical protein SO802_026932 [Lithocarpus litseifolius]|uniref:Uncharacterized protein n=1 Tax=Lithocarpus litseifolius TaxID=425828 RepID=A0AAW2C1G1_9ROSI